MATLDRCSTPVHSIRIYMTSVFQAQHHNLLPPENPLRVVVVDDDAISRLVLAQLLQTMGHVAVEAETAERALELMRGGDFDALLADLEMPGRNGFELLADWQAYCIASGRTPAPVVAVTGHASQDDRSRVIAAGFYDHLAKPIQLAAIESILLHIASARAVSPADPASRASAKRAALGTVIAAKPNEPRFVEHVLRTYADRAEQLIERARDAVHLGDRDHALQAVDTLGRAAAALGMMGVEAMVRAVRLRLQDTEMPIAGALDGLDAAQENALALCSEIAASLTGLAPAESE
jgi:CheY-like chemotaxis protein